jgi:tryptophanyl-tRNA synthetase
LSLWPNCRVVEARRVAVIEISRSGDADTRAGWRWGDLRAAVEVVRELDRRRGGRGRRARVVSRVARAPPLAVACVGVRIFSGIQPTGRKHLGNYVGAIAQYVSGQDRGEAIYCIVDLHAITVPHDPVELRTRVLDTTAILLAAGVDPGRCILFRQSDVPAHTELTWLLCAVTAHGDLNRMNQFREKSAAQRELVSAGLFLYPVLQAADVLVYRAGEVPVGDDQRQHIELMRDIAIRFNARFPDPATGGEILVVPEHRIPAVGARIMDLQRPESKMSTSNASVEGTVYVLDEPAAIEKKFKRAVTDSGSEIRRDPSKPGIGNLIEILAAIRGVGSGAIEGEYAGARYGDFKGAVAAAVIDYLAPVRERYADLRADEAGLDARLAEGAERAREIAGPTLADVRRAMGFGGPG